MELRKIIAAAAISLTCCTISLAPARAENRYRSINMDNSEYQLLREIVALEAQGEGQHGEELVLEVIFNRVLSDSFPDTVEGVLREKGQFATLKYVGAKNAWAHAGEMEDLAILAVLQRGPELLPSSKYVFFDTRGVNGRNHIKVGNHYFGEGK